MLAQARHLAALGLAAVVVAACVGGGAPTSPPTSQPTDPSASPTPSAAGYWLRMTTWQPIPPLDLFAVGPTLVITGDGVVVTQDAVPAIYPGPLLPNLVGRTISEAGRATIVAAARDLGLIGARTDFSGDAGLIGGVTGRIELTVDGRPVVLTGRPDAHIECITTPCDPAPGSEEAFGALWTKLLDLSSWLPAQLGPEAPYVPQAYALLVTRAPEDVPSLPQAPADWPLATPLATFGGPVANGTARCGTVSGEDATALRPALEAANQLTPWVEAPGAGDVYRLVVRPLTPGEDACLEMFGG